MALNLVVTDDAIDLEITGWYHRAVCFSGGMRIPMTDVLGARITTWDDARTGMGWRTRGAYVPGWIATGWYAVPDRKDASEFWAVFRDRDQLLVIDTSLERPARLVLAHADRERLAWWINERVAN